MKKGVLITLLFLSIIVSQAQSTGISVGYTPGGAAGYIDYNHHLENNSYLQIGAFGSYAKTDYKGNLVPFSDFSLNLGYYYPIFENNKQTTQLSIGAGGLLGYEMVNLGGDETLENGSTIESNSGVIYGGFLSGEMSFVVARNTVLLLKYNHFYHANSFLGDFTFFGGAGVRFYIN